MRILKKSTDAYKNLVCKFVNCLVFECNKVGSQRALSFVYCAVHYSALHKLPHITILRIRICKGTICIGFMQMLGKSETDGFLKFFSLVAFKEVYWKHVIPNIDNRYKSK